jgi:hypothetical protein
MASWDDYNPFKPDNPALQSVNSTLARNNLPKISNRLEDRSRLAFYFPDPNTDPPTPIYCPFFENPIINESQSANLVSYDVIGRAGNLFGYTGAKSRKFSVKFFMTLPLMMHLGAERMKTLGQYKDYKEKTTKELQDLFFEEVKQKYTLGANRAEKGRSWTSYAKQFVDSLDNGDPLGFEHMLNSYPGADPATPGVVSFAPKAVNPKIDTIADKQLQLTVDVMTYWVNLIRSSVLNNANRPVLGPPIIRLTFGSLYRNVATVASEYKISYDSVAGFDMASLLPHRVIIELVLHEVRLNTAEGFKPHMAVQSDSLAGWEHTYSEGYISSDPDSTRTTTTTTTTLTGLPPI